LGGVRACQAYLVSQGIFGWARNRTVRGSGFSDGVTLDRVATPERIVCAGTPRNLPAMPSADEVVRFRHMVLPA
jgi:hypothetical protein